MASAPRDPGLTAAEIAQRIGIGPRTLSKYRELGLIARPTLRGRHTRYRMLDVTRIAAIQALKRRGHRLSEMKHALAQLSSYELATLASPLLATAPSAHSASTAASATATSAPDAASPVRAAASPAGALPPGDAWHRTMLLPGLEMSIAASASEIVRRVAAEIAERYAARM